MWMAPGEVMTWVPWCEGRGEGASNCISCSLPCLGPSNHLATVHCTVTVLLYITWHTSDRWSHNAWEWQRCELNPYYTFAWIIGTRVIPIYLEYPLPRYSSTFLLMNHFIALHFPAWTLHAIVPFTFLPILVYSCTVCAVQWQCTVGHHLQHCTPRGSRPCVLSVDTLHTLSSRISDR